MQKYIFLFIFSLFLHVGYCQPQDEENKAKIAAVVENYFDLERESIHLHIDKTSFLTNESIWYQGYIINRKTNKPYFTTNVFMVLYDEKGNQLSEELIFADSGYFSGKIDLKPSMHSGNYYLQAYTNWMNNFNENESTITKIDVINTEEGIRNYKKLNESSLEITLTPEGNSFINKVSNIVGIQLKDCRGNAPKNTEATLQNSKGEILKTCKLNTFGLGKFEVIPNNENLKVVVNFNDKIIEKQLPTADDIGFAIETNDYTSEEKVIVKVKTNPKTLNVMRSKKLFLLAHQDQKYSIYNIDFNNESEQTIYLKKADLFTGINNLRIIDSDLKEWSERLIYIYPELKNKTAVTKNDRKGGNINLIGNSPFNNAYMSISVLPEDTKCWDDITTIFSGLTINPYLNEPLTNPNYYFSSLGRTKFYELDLALLNQPKTKYAWNYMKSNLPATNYSFDIGIDLKGKIDPAIKNKTYHKVKLVSNKDFIMMTSDVNENGEYSFDHILLADSTYVKMSLQKLPDFVVINNKLTPQVLNRKRPFYKPFKIEIPENCGESELIDFNSSFEFPKLSSRTIHLKEVIVGTEKKKLTYESRMGNAYLRGYKIDPSMQNQDVLYFIERNGFIVEKSAMDVSIYSRLIGSIRGARATPQVYIDERLIMSYDELIGMSMSDIDEIFLNPRAIVPSVNNIEGIIKIYRKKNIIGNQNQKQDINSFYIKEGFTRNSFFKNLDYENTQSDGFDNYGLIHWLPRIATDDNGNFNFEITDLNKEKGKFIIEGMTQDGQLFQEEKIIDLK